MHNVIATPIFTSKNLGCTSFTKQKRQVYSSDACVGRAIGGHFSSFPMQKHRRFIAVLLAGFSVKRCIWGRAEYQMNSPVLGVFEGVIIQA